MRLLRFLWCLFCVVAHHAGAQGLVVSESWNSVGGNAVALSVAADGFLIAAGRDASLWTWRSAELAWTPVAGEGTRVAALPGGRYFAVRRDGELAYFDGMRAALSGLRALDVAVDSSGFPYAIRNDGALVRKLSATSAWEVLAVVNGRRVALASDGAAWVALADGNIVRWQDGKLDPVAGSARELASGTDGSMLAVDREGILQRWSPFNRVWEPETAPPNIAALAIGPQDVAWIATANGTVMTRAAMQSKSVRIERAPNADSITFGKRKVTSATPAGAARELRGAAFVAITPATQTTDASPFVWIDTLATAASLTIAAREGSVFALDNSGNIGRWSNLQNRFLSYPGTFAKIAVEADGNLWGVNSLGRVFRRDTSIWHQIVGTASDLSIGLKGEVFATQSNGALFKYDRAVDTLLQVPGPGNLVSVAIAPDGVPWGLLRDAYVARCPTANCQRFTQTARSLAIGPDGSVFVITLDGYLRLLRKSLDAWDVIPVLGQPLSSVAVGPHGRPWVVAANGRVYASAYFPRDESTDLLEASTTSNQTTGSGAIGPVDTTTTGSGFAFSKNLLFDRIPVPGADKMSIGPDGTVLLLSASTNLFRYDSTKKTFVPITGFPAGNIRYAMYGPDSTLWILSSEFDGKIFHQRSGNNYETLQLPIPAPQPPPGGMNRSIAIGPDNSVYAIDTVGTLWRRTAGTTAFSKMLPGNFLKVAVSRTNDVWVIDNSNVVRQIVNRVAERRPLNRDVLASDLAGGRDGTIYITTDIGGTLYPAKWNPASLTFDQVSTPANFVGVAPDGRPWIWDTFTNPGVILRAR
ncbi:MAG: hypothetical protein JWN94_4397 [Betaproteobacteria bacterium]|nr:hypothetical protein [Betaproteobacteria bacterium]